MNRDRALLLADEIERPTLDIGWSMKCFSNQPPEVTVAQVREHPCGTVCCIGGMAVILFGEPWMEAGAQGAQGHAARLLDLTPEQQEQLFYNSEGYLNGPEKFYGDDSNGQWDVTRAEAAAGIRRMVAEEIAAEKALADLLAKIPGLEELLSTARTLAERRGVEERALEQALETMEKGAS